MNNAAPTLKRLTRRSLLRIVMISILFIMILSTIMVFISERNLEVKRTERIFARVSEVVKENEESLSEEEEAFRNSSLANARTVAYILQYHPEARESVEELEKICTNLEIDEIHIFDEKGVIIQGTQPQYYGYSFDSGEQMAFFKPLLTDKSLELVQDITPNTAAGKLEQYSALWSEDGTFIVEVGMHPERVLQVREKNEVPYVFHLVGAGGDDELYTVDLEKNVINVSTDSDKDGKTPAEIGLSSDKIKNRANGFFAYIDSELYYCVSRLMGDEYYVRTVEAYGILKNIFVTELILLGAVLVMFFLLTKVVMGQIDTNVIKPIHRMNGMLKDITDGNYEIHIEPQYSEEFNTLGNYVNDMSASIRQHIDEVRYQSRHDALTKTWNRNVFQITLGELKKADKTAAILYADLNGLKKINDEKGHEAGDNAIMELAEDLKEIFGEYTVFRVGGDEFVVLDDEITEDEMKKKVEVLKERWSMEGHSASTGLAFCPKTSEIARYIHLADEAMYEMKRTHYDQRKRK